MGQRNAAAAHVLYMIFMCFFNPQPLFFIFNEFVTIISADKIVPNEMASAGWNGGVFQNSRMFFM
jgi:hypothetical protein